jgi:DMSO/TMAO reductase YedYZ molybdopterin-dependent catalytic subunit
MSEKKTIISPINLRKDRLPPGQRWIEKPILYDISPNTDFDMSSYNFKVYGEVEVEKTFTYEELISLPQVELIADFHCVTHWSVKDIHWEGVQTKEILNMVKPKSPYLLVHSLEGYTTNLPVEYLFEDDVILAFKINGEILPKRQGYPVRLVVPKLYAWKSAKYVTAFKFTKENIAGYWEQRGYHMHGDPWKNERYG